MTADAHSAVSHAIERFASAAKVKLRFIHVAADIRVAEQALLASGLRTPVRVGDLAWGRWVYAEWKILRFTGKKDAPVPLLSYASAGQIRSHAKLPALLEACAEALTKETR